MACVPSTDPIAAYFAPKNTFTNVHVTLLPTIHRTRHRFGGLEDVEGGTDIMVGEKPVACVSPFEKTPNEFLFLVPLVDLPWPRPTPRARLGWHELFHRSYQEKVVKRLGIQALRWSRGPSLL